ncbi:protein of unknown function [Taphrina deformans PYCC 5710]|uniref:Uncharacterized protein n=1 Tax=Taphrina deformans (strain PYCC 5710 / ATCC 11124 / CBS 356.35 / IMI 108563 / JCM 9778 / NBRC 8474) TaxID=1097556 RepID=R4XGQ1_TAPDE|nr:protein of unknown function [Taphrina deformans PYCC 5710]|eukprot:CCG85072.1 protein of unknown function [Taphrina deformans PYCC 5710]
MLFATSILALSSLAAAAHNSVSEGETVTFNGGDFSTVGAKLSTALEAANSAGNGDWYLNYYDFGLGFDDNRQIFAYYPSTPLGGSSTCVGIIEGLKAGAPNGKNGGCDSVWGNGCSELIIKAINGGCNTTMFSGLPPSCGTLNVEVQTVSTTTFTPSNPAVWLTWNYANNGSAQPEAARDLTYPVFARSSDGTAHLACLRVNGGAATIGSSIASLLVVGGSALYMLF